MRRFIVYVIYDPQSMIYDYVNTMLNELRKHSTKLVVVCNFDSCVYYPFQDVEEVIYRENKGFDAAAYAEVITKYESEIHEYDELMITNDTYYGPLFPFYEMFNKMEQIKCDYWGITFHPGGHLGNIEIPEHIQSYFLNFKRSIILDDDFYKFWRDLSIDDSLNETILHFEIGINVFLGKKGYLGCSYMGIQGFNTLLNKDDNPYMMYSYELISTYRVPIIKRRSLSFDNPQFENSMKALTYIREKLDYDIDNIISNIWQLSTINSNTVTYNYIKLNDFICKHTRLYIYGNGKWANNMDAYINMMRYPIAIHVVSEKKTGEQTCLFSDIELREGDGIIIAVSNPIVISEIYNTCLTRFKPDDIIFPTL